MPSQPLSSGPHTWSMHSQPQGTEYDGNWKKSMQCPCGLKPSDDSHLSTQHGLQHKNTSNAYIYIYTYVNIWYIYIYIEYIYICIYIYTHVYINHNVYNINIYIY